MPDVPPVTAAELARRTIQPADFAPDREAFVDVRIERSKGKASYSFIGPGVSQNDDQTINLVEPHGFNVGAASMPHGVVNNPHLHYTAEVFICTGGEWEYAVGEHGDQILKGGPGHVFSAPPWVFRGFRNIGPDDGFLFVVLGGDDTGGIIWAPHILREAAETGMFLGLDNSLIDTSLDSPLETQLDGPNGASANGSTNGTGGPVEVLQPLGPEQLEAIDHYSDEELAARMVAADELVWSEQGLLSSVLGPAHAGAVAPVIGHGLTEDRRSRPPIATPHGFALEWLRLAPGASTGRHRHDDTQVIVCAEGDWEVAVNDASDEVSTRPATGSLVSIPAATWRDLRNVGSTEARCLVVTGGDGPTRLDWSSDIVERARLAGHALDAAGYVAPVELLRQAPTASASPHQTTQQGESD